MVMFVTNQMSTKSFDFARIPPKIVVVLLNDADKLMSVLIVIATIGTIPLLLCYLEYCFFTIMTNGRAFKLDKDRSVVSLGKTLKNNFSCLDLTKSKSSKH